jgi:hypothetical protein
VPVEAVVRSRKVATPIFSEPAAAGAEAVALAAVHATVLDRSEIQHVKDLFTQDHAGLHFKRPTALRSRKQSLLLSVAQDIHFSISFLLYNGTKWDEK